MAFFEWNEGMSVGVAEFDSHHQRLVELVNTLFDAMRMGKARTVIGDLLKELIEYTCYHFEAEEAKMKQHRYPGYVAHVAEHEKLKEEVGILFKKFQGGDIFISVDTLNFLRDWLMHHIMETDMGYKPFLNTKGIQ